MKLEGQHRFEAPRALVWKALLDPEVLSRTLPGCEALQSTGENQFAGALNMKIGPVSGQFKGSVQLSDLVEPESYKLKLNGQGGPGFVNGTGQLLLEEDGTGTVLRYSVDAQVGGRIASIGQRLVESSAKVITRQALESLDAQIRAIAAQAAVAPARPALVPEATPSEVTATVPVERPGAAEGLPAASVASGDGRSSASVVTEAEAPTGQPSEVPQLEVATPDVVLPQSIPAARPLPDPPAVSVPPLPPRPAAPTQAQFAAAVAKGVLEDLIPPQRRPWILAVGVALMLVIVFAVLRAC